MENLAILLLIIQKGMVKVNKTEMLKLFVLIERVYPGFRLKNDIVHYYFKKCEEMDYEQAMASIKDHIRKSPYPPSISSIAAKSFRSNSSSSSDPRAWQEEYILSSDIS
ncbi:hypothetical protein [Bacillus sp. J33]|uniref:hypothetical protein n=1 Tax=Bacillus sp. J33 TaxID=935836 RepID=UPI0004B06625|nr:hypothetical protein [Bacillus sp. J33]